MEVIETWTGRHANALRNALRLTNEGFAEALGTSLRTITKWNANPDRVPVSEMQRALDTTLARASADVHARFTLLLTTPRQGGQPTSDATVTTSNPATNTELRLHHDPDVNAALDWLDDYAGWPVGEARNRVAALVQQLDARTLRDDGRRRSRLNRESLTSTLAKFYKIDSSEFHLYSGPYSHNVTTSVLTKPEWLDLRLTLGQGNDHLGLVSDEEYPIVDHIDNVAASAASRRVAEILSTDTRLVNRPLYRLVDLTIGSHGFSGSVALVDFCSYALTLDLLERELYDAIVDNADRAADHLPLRTHYLPSLASVTNISQRLCAGGPLALFAIARSRGRQMNQQDYVLLIQERSSQVLNATRKLAVIPKAFHQPLIDFSDDSQITATLERELEEELFGRTDVDSTVAERKHADPLNINRLSEPMRWLIERASGDHWHMECTGFGLNLVSGNFEFASLIVIDDEEWWQRFGDQIEANWESDGLRRYSSRDHDGLTSLIRDSAWSDEGLFSFLQGLRRLSEINGDRVNSPLTNGEM